jgi:Zn-dependent protease
MLLVVGFGWGKPVPVNGAALRNGRRSMAVVSLAGPASNVVLALTVAFMFQLGLLDFDRAALSGADPRAYAAVLGRNLVVLNLILATFNLLPFAPLDGSGVLRGIVPSGWLPSLRRIEAYGPVVLLVVVGLQILSDVSVLGFLFGPVIDLANTLVGA